MPSPNIILSSLIRHGHWEAVLNHITHFPSAASTPITINFGEDTSCRALPIHVSILASKRSTRPVPLRVISAFVTANPDVLRTKDSLGRLPLHYAARYNVPLDILTAVLSPFPQGACVTSDEGALPLMLACLHGDSVDKVKALLDAYPEAASNDRRDDSGLTAFEYASDNPRPIKVDILYLIASKISELAISGDGLSAEARLHGASDVQPSTQSVGGITEREEVEEVVAEPEIVKPGTKLCCICLERAVARVLVPCGHTILCAGCGDQQGLSRIDYKCPECRSDVEQAIRIFARIADD